MKNRDAYKMYPQGQPLAVRREQALMRHKHRYSSTMRTLGYRPNPRPGQARHFFIYPVWPAPRFSIWTTDQPVRCVGGINSVEKARRILPEVQRRGWRMSPSPII